MDERLGLDNREFIYFTVQAIACGDWRLLKIERETALDLIKSFAASIYPPQIDPELFTAGIYETVQNSMLAQKLADFETLQRFPPFSEFGRKNLTQLLTFQQTKGALALENNFQRTFRDGWEARRPEREIIKIVSGNGRTIETPVKFSTADIEKRVRAEYWFITYNYGKKDESWERGVHYTISHPKTFKMISNWKLTLANGETIDIYFDTDRDR